MSSQRYDDDGTPVHTRPGTQAQARTPRPRPRREPEPDPLEDAGLSDEPRTRSSARRYRPTTQQPEPEQHALTRRPNFHVQVYEDYTLDGRGKRIPPRSSRGVPPALSPAHASAARRAAPPKREQQHTARPRPRVTLPRAHPLLSVGLTACALVLLWMGLVRLFAWGSYLHDNALYGYPRTSQCDAVVGHGDAPERPSHFIALNLHTHIEVIELPGGDATHMKVYLGPVLIGEGQDLVPVTLTFQDVNGDGKPDMLLHFGSQVVILLNQGDTFRPVTPSDHVSL